MNDKTLHEAGGESRLFENPEAIDNASVTKFRVESAELSFNCDFDFCAEADRLLVVSHLGRTDPYPGLRSRSLLGKWQALRIANPLGPLSPAERPGLTGTGAGNVVLGVLRIVARFRELLSIDADRIVYLGYSSAGFAALMCAIGSDGAAAIALNAKLELAEFQGSPGSCAPLRMSCKKTDLGQLDTEQPLDRSVTRLLKGAHQAGWHPRLLLCQNTIDDSHYVLQFKPFCEAFGLSPERGLDEVLRVETRSFYAEGGHDAFWPPEPVLRVALDRFASVTPFHEADSPLPPEQRQLAPDAFLNVIASGRALPLARYEHGFHHFRVPPDIREVHLTTVAFQPSKRGAPDDRLLGVAVSAIRILLPGASRSVDLAGNLLLEGWHSVEGPEDCPWRWTDGNGRLRLPPGTQAVEIATRFRRTA